MTLTHRTGITMRVVRSEHGETRDALARDWPVLLERLGRVYGFAPEWFLLPNMGEDSVALARRYGVRALLLTGGDDRGATPDRDLTEEALLRWAAGEGLPVLGICRGAQMLARQAGATLCAVRPDRHVAARHRIVWNTDGNGGSFWNSALAVRDAEEVNSFHRWGLSGTALPANLHAVAVCPEDGSVEAFCHASLPWMGIFWHPERETTPRESDMAILRHLFAEA